MRSLYLKFLFLLVIGLVAHDQLFAQHMSETPVFNQQNDKQLLRWNGTSWEKTNATNQAEAGTDVSILNSTPELVANPEAIATMPRTPYFRDGLANRTFYSDILTENMYNRYNGVNRYMPFYGIFNSPLDGGSMLLSNIGLGLLGFGAGVPTFGPRKPSAQTIGNNTPTPIQSNPDPFEW